jgi:ATP-dependent exoDNAse (exonuclease V) alpha subunit
MTDREQRISDIINRLESLTLEANGLVQQLQELRKPDNDPGRKEKDKNESPSNDFKEGEKVIITNNYRGKRGTIGTVTHTTKKQVTLEDDSGKSYIRKYTNVSRIKK